MSHNRKKCRLGCECKDSGFVEVHNFGLFDPKLKTITIVCNGPLGDWINSRRAPSKRSPVYDPETMILVGEPIPVKQKQLF
ncbi:MAG: hypothetical protein KDA77_00320 [Planctomycetaceae bacterium]|nr:hypothetical protein [Planctomycetaceae bacterium]